MKDNINEAELIKSCDNPQRLDPQAGETIDHFTILQFLGDGAFGTVFKVKDARDGGIYALKIIKLWEIVKQDRKGGQRAAFVLAICASTLTFNAHLQHAPSTRTPGLV